MQEPETDPVIPCGYGEVTPVDRMSHTATLPIGVVFRHSRRLRVTDKWWHCSVLHGWSAQTTLVVSAVLSHALCAGGHEL